MSVCNKKVGINLGLGFFLFDVAFFLWFCVGFCCLNTRMVLTGSCILGLALSPWLLCSLNFGTKTCQI